jgi:hypothetical protein
MAIKKKTAEAAPAKSSFASAFDGASAGGGAVDFPIGDCEAVITEFSLDGFIADDGEEQGKLAAIATFVNDDGKTIKSRYSLCDDEGNIKGGVGFLKKDLSTLGYDIDFSTLEATLEEIAGASIRVNIRTKQNGQYINAYLQSVVSED